MPTPESPDSDALSAQPNVGILQRLLRAVDVGLDLQPRASRPKRRRRVTVVPVATEHLGIATDVEASDLTLIADIGPWRHPSSSNSLPKPRPAKLTSRSPRVISALDTEVERTIGTIQAVQTDLIICSKAIAAHSTKLTFAIAEIVHRLIETYEAPAVKRRREIPTHVTHPVTVTAAPEAGRSTMALTRRKVRALNDAHFVQEHRALASAAGVSIDEIQWIALFPLVPLAATQMLKIDEKRGILSIWVKNDATEILNRRGPWVVNVAIGRNKHTGAVVRALIS